MSMQRWLSFDWLNVEYYDFQPYVSKCNWTNVAENVIYFITIYHTHFIVRLSDNTILQ